MKRADNLMDFMNVFHSAPLEGEDFESFYVDTDKVHGSETRKLKFTCLHSKNPYAKILFSGPAGSGKTTEMYRLASSPEIMQQFEVIRIKLMEDLDLYNLDYVDLIFEIMSAIILHFEKCHTQSFHEIAPYFEPLYNYWHSEHFQTIFQEDLAGLRDPLETGIGATAPLGLEVIAKLKFLIKVAVRGQGILRTAVATKKELRAKVEPKMDGLLECINVIIQGINKVIAPKQLLIIVDDLDKADSQCVENLFVNHIEPIFAMNVKMICMVPIFLEASPKFKRVRNRADANYVLSAIIPSNGDSIEIPENIEFLEQLVFKRAEEHLFDETTLRKLIKSSGGILRDLFYLLVDASLNATIEHPDDVEKILMDDVNKACVKLRTEYAKSIEMNKYCERLKILYYDEEQTFEDKILMELLYTNVILEYGEERHKLVHPLVVDYMLNSHK